MEDLGFRVSCVDDNRSELLNELKKQVKQVMEEAVCMKVVHEMSTNLTALCMAIENCLAHGLRKRLFGFFGRASTYALLHKIAVSFPPASSLLRLTIETEKTSGESKKILNSQKSLNREELESVRLRRKLLWIRLGLTEKVLDLVVDYIAKNAFRYYDEDALMYDSVSGNMVAALLVGPCALEFTKATVLSDDNCFNGFTMSQLLQRHRFRSVRSLERGNLSPNLSLTVRRTSSLGSDILNAAAPPNLHDYFLSLHHGAKSSLLYAKNNIAVHQPGAKPSLKGYLSLHYMRNGEVELRWTPNELMKSETQSSDSSLWNMAILINLSQISCIHCHGKSSGSILAVFIGLDGVQYPSIRFEHTMQLLDFLSCLDTGLRPGRRLEPNLHVNSAREGFIALLEHSSSGGSRGSESDIPDSPTCVLRIIHTAIARDEKDKIHSEIAKSKMPPRTAAEEDTTAVAINTIASVQSACDSISHQILCRAFYGWLALCRHMKMVRTHLKCLVTCDVSSYEALPPECSGKAKLTAELWAAMRSEPKQYDERQLLQLVYQGGCEMAIRQSVWPFLLNVFKWDNDEEAIDAQKKSVQQIYENTMAEWQAVEAVVRKQEQETLNQVKLFNKQRSDGTLSTEYNISNEVFVDSVDETESTSPCTVQQPAFSLFVSQEEKKSEKHRKLHSEDSGYDGSAKSNKNFSYDRCNTEQTESPSIGTEQEESCESPKNVINLFATNLRRIDNDVLRCDRHHPYFKDANLVKLKNVICTYTWQHLESGYVQGMCDLVAPLLVIFDEEVLTYMCFTKLMERMDKFFPGSGEAMDSSLSCVIQLLQVFDCELFDVLYLNGDYTHCYFCYRWFLLDFKREFTYEDTFRVWEVIWSANRYLSPNFSIFIAFGLIELYRDVVVETSMDFTDILRFYADTTGQHDTTAVLNLAKRTFDLLCTSLKEHP